MTVEQKIKRIVDSMEGVSYLFDNWQTANIRLDRIKLPAVLNLLPVSGTFNLGRQQLRDCPNCMMAFMDKAGFDFDGTENDAVIEGCKNKAKEFILLSNRSGMFKEISGDIPYSVFYDRLDVNVTGIVIQLKLEETTGTVICRKSVKEIVYGSRN